MAISDQPVQLRGEELDRVRQTLQENIDLSESAVTAPRADVERWREYMEDTLPTDKPIFKGASTIRVPFVKSSILAVQAEVYPAVLDIEPIIHVEGTSPESRNMADELELFYDALLRREMGSCKANSANSLKRVIHYGLRDGACVTMQTWETCEQMVWGWDEEESSTILDEETGEIEIEVVRSPKQSMQVVYDAPKITVIPIDRFFTIPSFDVESVQTCAGVGFWMNISGTALVQGTRNGMFDAEAAEELLKTMYNLDTQVNPDDALAGTENSSSNNGDEHELQQKSIKLHQVWMKYSPKRDDGTKVPASDWLFVLHKDTGTILRAEPNPWWGYRRKFAVYRPYSNTASVFGDSLAGVGGGHVQEAKTSLLQFGINQMIRHVNPRRGVPKAVFEQMKANLIDSSWLVDPGSVVPIPQQLLESGNTGIVNLEDGTSPLSVIEFSAYMDQEGQKYTGVNDINKGGGLPGDASATEVVNVMESSRKLIGQIIANTSEYIGELAEQMHELVMQFKDRESMQALWEQTGGASGEYSLDDVLNGVYYLTSNGGLASSKIVLAKQAMDRYMMMTSNPEVWGMLGDVEKYKVIADALQYGTGTRNVQDYLGTKEQYAQRQEQVRQQAQMLAMQQAMPPGGGEMPPSPEQAGGQEPMSEEEEILEMLAAQEQGG